VRTVGLPIAQGIVSSFSRGRFFSEKRGINGIIYRCTGFLYGMDIANKFLHIHSTVLNRGGMFGESIGEIQSGAVQYGAARRG
jgi:hypothetical protein